MVAEIADVIFTRLEKNLEKNEEQFRQLIEYLPDVLYSYTLKQGGIFYSPASFTILGYTPEYLLEHPFTWKNSIHPDELPAVEAAVRDFILGKPFDLTYRIRHANSDWLWLRDRSVNCYEQDGDFVIQGIATDITAQVNADEKLAQALEIAETARVIKNRFLANISKEIKAPLYSIICTTRLLKSSGLTADQDAYLAAIDQAVNYLLGLTSDTGKLEKTGQHLSRRNLVID